MNGHLSDSGEPMNGHVSDSGEPMNGHVYCRFEASSGVFRMPLRGHAKNPWPPPSQSERPPPGKLGNMIIRSY